MPALEGPMPSIKLGEHVPATVDGESPPALPPPADAPPSHPDHVAHCGNTLLPRRTAAAGAVALVMRMTERQGDATYADHYCRRCIAFVAAGPENRAGLAAAGGSECVIAAMVAHADVGGGAAAGLQRARGAARGAARRQRPPEQQGGARAKPHHTKPHQTTPHRTALNSTTEHDPT